MNDTGMFPVARSLYQSEPTPLVPSRDTLKCIPQAPLLGFIFVSFAPFNLLFIFSKWKRPFEAKLEMKKS
jgi:hypothetical protein